MIRFPVPLDADLNPISEDDLKQYAIRTPKAVEALFNAACIERQPVALRGAGTDRRAVGELTEVRAGDALVLTGADDDIDFMPLASQDQVDCIVLVERVTVRFLARVRSLRIVEGRLILETEWPHLVLRRQRRENFRMPMSGGRAPLVFLGDTADQAAHPFRVVDLSGGGLSLVVEDGGREFRVGDVLVGCRLELGPLESVSLSLVVRSREAWTMKTGDNGWRYGCAFENLSGQAEQLVRRYVIHAERSSLRARSVRP